jgi:hypothetical protein
MDIKIERLDTSGNDYLDKIITAYELAKATLQETFDDMASRPGPAIERFLIDRKIFVDTRNLGG